MSFMAARYVLHAEGRLVRQELVKKYQILAKGYEKRSKKAEARKCLACIEKFRPKEKN